MSENHPVSGGPRPVLREAVIDAAIDRAVRQIAQVDPRPGLSGRVRSRILTAGGRRSLYSMPFLAVAGALAVLVLAIGLVRPDPSSEVAPASAVTREAPMGAPRQYQSDASRRTAEASSSNVPPATSEPPSSGTSHTSGPAAAPPSGAADQKAAANGVAVARQRNERAATGSKVPQIGSEEPGTHVEAIPMPEIVNLFSGAPNLVTGANVSRATEPAAAPSAAASPPADVKRRNVNIEITITDETGTADPVRNTVTMTVADRQMGSVRSSGNVAVAPDATPNVEHRNMTLNVDANPVVHSDDSMLLTLTLEYVPRPEAGQDASKRSAQAALNERMAVTLESGTPMVILRSADPGSDRKITVEVTATVMK